MHTLFIQKWANLGGSKESLLEMLGAMQGDGALSATVITAGPGPFVERCRAVGVQVMFAQLPEWRKFPQRLSFGPALRRAATMCAGMRVAWVVSNEMWWAPHAARLASLLRCRSAVILRDGITTADKARKYRLAQNDRILCVSSALQQNLAGDATMSARTRVVYDCIRLRPPSADGAARLAARLAAFPRVERWIAVVARVGLLKNQIDAVRVLKLLHDGGHADVGLILAGACAPEYEPALQQAITSAGLAEHTVLLGHFNDITLVYAMAAAVLLTSTREGLPRCVVEGLLAGRPTFTYPCQGTSDIFAADARIFVSDRMTPDSMAKKIIDAWKDSAALREAVDDATARVCSQFSPEGYLAVLKQVLAAE